MADYDTVTPLYSELDVLMWYTQTVLVKDLLFRPWLLSIITSLVCTHTIISTTAWAVTFSQVHVHGDLHIISESADYINVSQFTSPSFTNLHTRNTRIHNFEHGFLDLSSTSTWSKSRITHRCLGNANPKGSICSGGHNTISRGWNK